MAHKQTKTVKDTWKMLFGIEFVSFFGSLFCFLFLFLESDSSECLRVFTKTSSIFLCRPAKLKRPMTDIFCRLTCLLPIYTLIDIF